MSLSDKIKYNISTSDIPEMDGLMEEEFVEVEDIQESIKELKDKIQTTDYEDDGDILMIIDEVFGSQLLSNSQEDKQ